MDESDKAVIAELQAKVKTLSEWALELSKELEIRTHSLANAVEQLLEESEIQRQVIADQLKILRMELPKQHAAHLGDIRELMREHAQNVNSRVEEIRFAEVTPSDLHRTLGAREVESWDPERDKELDRERERKYEESHRQKRPVRGRQRR